MPAADLPTGRFRGNRSSIEIPSFQVYLGLCQVDKKRRATSERHGEDRIAAAWGGWEPPPSAVSQVVFKAAEAFKKPEAGMCLRGMLHDQCEGGLGPIHC